MSKIKDKFSKRKIKVSKELIKALEVAQLPDDLLDLIISYLERIQGNKRKQEEVSKDITVYASSDATPQEILINTYRRLDGQLDRTNALKSRVDELNSELQEIAYYG